MVITNLDQLAAVKEPLLWFTVMGSLLFIGDRFTGPQPIFVDQSVRNQIASLWEAQMGLPPSGNELDSLVNNWIREEIFFRESLRLGLDNEDTIIRRRLVQKLTFLAQEVDEDTITRADIETYYESNLREYTLPVRYSLSQIYFSANSMAEELRTALKDGRAWRELGQSSLLPRTLVRKNLREITSTFGTEFAEQIDNLQEGQWVGPITSTFGLHLVRLDTISESEVTPLPYIEKQVMTDLIHKRREASLNDYYEELLTHYDVKYR